MEMILLFIIMFWLALFIGVIYLIGWWSLLIVPIGLIYIGSELSGRGNSGFG
jgi:hypothetical protein